MRYKSLLFCPDDKTARVVTQVLSELEFDVELCNEPFAAVKKLMAEHFDALVVDCENEQNATLLFKSSRNSASNQTSLSVAVVEGQAGVAKAFRIGANLVLTKPINVEQSKGTLRVARGLLRKSETGKPSASPTPAVAAVTSQPQPTPKLVTPPQAFISTPVAPPAPIMSASASSVFELEKEPEPKPEPTEAALLESMSEPMPTKPAAAGLGEKSAKQFPWEPKPEKEHTSNSEVFAETESSLSSSTSSHGAATGVARAKEIVPKNEPAEVVEPTPVAISHVERPKSGSGIKAVAIAATILIAAGAGYVTWTKMHPHAAPVAHQKQVTPVPAAPPAITTPTLPVTAPSVPTTVDTTTTPTPTPAPRIQEKNTISTEVPSVPKKAPGKASTPAPVSESSEQSTAEADPNALIVSGGKAPHVSQPAVSQEDASAPDLSSVGSNSNAISGLVNAPATVPTAAPQTLRVSQGISQGLLVKKVPPVYPPQAMSMRLQGAVQLSASISKDGGITSVKVLNGDPLLAHAAIDAVKQWKYKPYYLDGQPVEIQTQITVNFKLP